MPFELPKSEPEILNKGIFCTDPFNKFPLFKVQIKDNSLNKKDLIVRSWEESFALKKQISINDINPEFVASIISRIQSCEISPYLNIKRIPRSSEVRISDIGNIEVTKKKTFDLKNLKQDKENDPYLSVRNKILTNLKNINDKKYGLLGCEHSSGLDSNLIISSLIDGLNINSEELITISFMGCGEGELINKFRNQYNLSKANFHFKDTDFSRIKPSENINKMIDILGFPHHFGYDIDFLKFLYSKKCSDLLSGFGGDQCISHNALNLPTDYLKKFKFLKLFSWMKNSSVSKKFILGNILAILYPNWRVQKIQEISNIGQNYNPAIIFLNDSGKDWLSKYIRKDYLWEKDRYVSLKKSMLERLNSDWISIRVEEETRIAKFFKIRKHFPFLDASLIRLILNQDESLFGNGFRKGRLFIREAFKDFLPDELYLDPSKYRDHNSETIHNLHINQIENCLIEMEDCHELIKKYWKVDEIIKNAERQLSSNKKNMNLLHIYSTSLISLLKISCWFKLLS